MARRSHPIQNSIAEVRHDPVLYSAQSLFIFPQILFRYPAYTVCRQYIKCVKSGWLDDGTSRLNTGENTAKKIAVYG
jgi:hypothetical protein